MAWAMANAISAVRMQWSQYDNGYITERATENEDLNTPTGLHGYWSPASRPGDHFVTFNHKDEADQSDPDTSLWRPQDYTTLAALDKVFLANLGIDVADPDSDVLTRGWQIVNCQPGQNKKRWKLGRTFSAPVASPAPAIPAPPETGLLTGAVYNIRMLRRDDRLKTPWVFTLPVSGAVTEATSLNRSRVMELVLNDMRMSFLGSNAVDYADFRPLDFNGDGKVHCSCYPSNSGALTKPIAPYVIAGTPEATVEALTAKDYLYADAKAMCLDQWVDALGDGAGPVLTPNGAGRALIASDSPFSMSGNFFIGKSRHYRIIARGELWDNLVQRPVSGVTIDSVIAVDPQVKNANGLNASSIVYQRYHWKKSQGANSQIQA